jgi:multiple sugar transport system substrate-binding protein
MATLTRRSVLRGSAAVAVAGTLARPYIANAAATTAEVWWPQGFVPEEDVAIKKIVADYQKASGNTIDLSIAPFAPQRQKIVAEVTSGVVPDLFRNTPDEIVALFAWDDKLVDVTDVVETQKEEYTETALLNTYCYNNVEKKRNFYGVPDITVALPNHIWRPLVEKAGYKIEDIPKTWDAYYDFFKDVQKKLRAQGVRNVYGLGLQVTTNGNDPNQLFNYFLIAYGGQGIVTKDGKLHLDDPEVREAAIKALTYPATAYKEGSVPPGAINWNDADDNNAFHAKQIVMDLDGTISTEVAVLSQGKKDDYDDIVTMGLPLTNDGKPVPSQAASPCGLIPKGAKNIAVAKDFLKSAPGGVHPTGPARTDRAVILCLQPGLCPSPERACMERRLDRYHARRDDAAGSRREGLQAGRGDLREVSHRAGLKTRRRR